MPDSIRRAVIDIGTNSVKLLIADFLEGEWKAVFETSHQTRLGRGFYEFKELQKEPVTLTIDVVKDFVDRARGFSAAQPSIIATSAVRDAINRNFLTDGIYAATGIRTEVISGDQEAEWGFRGVASDARFGKSAILVVDVGGGSTEFILGANRQIAFQRSYPLGSVRLWEQLEPGDAPDAKSRQKTLDWIVEFLKQEVVQELQPALAKLSLISSVIGVGGTTAILAHISREAVHFDRDLVDSIEFNRPHLQQVCERLWSLPLHKRRLLPGLPPERADVILTGSAIFESILEVFDLPTLKASTRGLRFGLLLREIPQSKKGKPASLG